MPSLPVIFLAQAILIGLILLFRDYRQHQTGPPAWWRLWIKSQPVAPPTPVPSVPTSAGAAATTEPTKTATATTTPASTAASVTGSATSGYYGKIDNTNALIMMIMAAVIFMMWNKK